MIAKESKKEMIKVLIVDDSALVRKTLTSIFDSDPEIEVIGTAGDPYVAVEKIRKEKPDVITLDVEMPRMDGLTFLSKLMAQHPVPVIIISTLTEKSAENAILAMEYGAVEVIAKPKVGTRLNLEASRAELCDKVKAASVSFVRRRMALNKESVSLGNTPDQKSPLIRISTTDKIVALGASTGGTEAIKTFLLAMPVDCPGILITQHMPEMFTTQFAKRLNSLCGINVKEAANGDSVLRGTALIAPGNRQMRLNRSGARYYVEITDEPPVNRHKPSVDVLFESVARHAGQNAVGVIMTGMGGDGSKGMKEMHDNGAYTIAQDEASCVVFGMPKEAIKLGAVDEILSLDKIGPKVIERTLNRKNVLYT